MTFLWRLHGILQRRLLTGFYVVVLTAGLPFVAGAYVLEGFHWPTNQPIVLGLQLGNANGTLIDGSTSWDQVAEAAAGIWNPYLSSGVQFQTKETNLTPAQGDGRNSVFFSDSVFGEGFGDDTLATTATLYNASTHVTVESDVVFNTAVAFNSYRGPLRLNGAQSVYDLRRVALHEFGHVLGLDHVPQTTPAIMTPVTTDIDTIQADDIAGVESIYGNPAPTAPAISSALAKNASESYPFSYQITATQSPSSFQAAGLPAGLSINMGSGLISGTPTVAGTYSVTITATNGLGSGTATLKLFIGTSTTITSSLSATAYLGGAFYYQITTAGQTTGFMVTNLPPGLAADVQTGLISGTPTQSGTFRVQLEAKGLTEYDSAVLVLSVVYDDTLTVLHNFSDRLDDDGTRLSSLVAASDGNLYGTTSAGGSQDGGTFFKLATDGTLSVLHSFGEFDGSPNGLCQGTDGSFYGTTREGGVNSGGTVFRVTADGTMSVVGKLVGPSSYGLATPSVLQGADGNLYGTQRYYKSGYNFHGSIFKLTPDGTLTTLHQFNGIDGDSPTPLIQASDGNLYGAASAGGSNSYGTLFKITPDGIFTTLHHFAANEGTCPLAPLIQATDGNFYGVTSTSQNGAGNGTVFAMSPDGTVSTIHSLTDSEGFEPSNALIQGKNGNFYGLTNGGLQIAATLFELTPDGALTTRHTFADPDGSVPFTGLSLDANGNIYGGADGGPDGGGTIFKETPNAIPFVYAPPPVVVPTVTLAAAVPQVTTGSGATGEFMLSLSAAQTTDTVVDFTIKGTAVNGTDYVLLKSTKKIKAGKTSKPIKVIPQGDLGGVSKKTVVLTLQPGDGYTVGTTDKVKVKVVTGQ